MEQGLTFHRVPLAASCISMKILPTVPGGRWRWSPKYSRVQALRTPGEELADLGVTLAACETDEAFTIAVTKMDGTRDETAARTSLAARWKSRV